MEKTLKLDGLALIHKKQELIKRNAKAESYSAMVERRLERRAERKRKLLALITSTAICISCGAVAFAEQIKAPTNAQIVCDVVATHTEYTCDLKETFLVCRTPDGEIYEVPVEEVGTTDAKKITFETTNENNYATYKVVDFE